MHKKSSAVRCVASNSSGRYRGRVKNVRSGGVGVNERRPLKVRLALQSAYVQVEVFAKSAVTVISVDILAPAVKELMQVVQVILTSAAGRVARSSGLTHRQSASPAIVLSNTQKYITVVVPQCVSKETSASADVKVGISTIPSRCTTAFVPCDLHKTLLSTSANSFRSARALLESERCQKDCGDSELAGITVEQRDES